MAEVFIGTSGYSYMHWWDDIFYPKEVPQSKWLEYYIKYFNTVELNNTFYRLPQKSAFTSWYKRAPADFVFAVKASRFITGIKRLKDAKEPVNLFMDRASGLNEKLGPILFQLPPNFKINMERLNDFLELLLEGRLYSFEFRHESWFTAAVFEALKRHNIALCIADWPEFAVGKPATASFVYVRRHGATALYSSCYSDEELAGLAGQIRGWWQENRDVYVYFNNDAYGYAVKNALRLKELVGVGK